MAQSERRGGSRANRLSSHAVGATIPHTDPMLENFRLRVFREVAQRQSFRRAAEVLYITQPAVTQQIKALESDLQQRLFDRSGGRVRLTEAGQQLLSYAQRSHALLDEAQERVAAVGGRMRGTLVIAASTTVAQYLLPRLMASFAQEHPEVGLQLESSNTERVVEHVAAGEAALGLIEGPAHRPDLLLEPWIEDELVLVVPAAHPWAGRAVSPAELRSAMLLLREQGSGTRAVLEAALAEAGLRLDTLQVGMELGSTETLLACIEAGLGVGFASRFALRRQRRLRTLAVARLQGVRVTRQLSLLRQRGPEVPSPASAFADHLRMYARQRADRHGTLPKTRQQR